jgi:acetoin utilization deacetylase AcuC-like enzyme
MTQLLGTLHKQIFIVLEGGYNLECLKSSTEAVLEGLQKIQEK